MKYITRTITSLIAEIGTIDVKNLKLKIEKEVQKYPTETRTQFERRIKKDYPNLTILNYKTIEELRRISIEKFIENSEIVADKKAKEKEN